MCAVLLYVVLVSFPGSIRDLNSWTIRATFDGLRFKPEAILLAVTHHIMHENMVLLFSIESVKYRIAWSMLYLKNSKG